MKAKQVMKLIVYAKLALVVTALCLYQGWIKFGDVALFAEDKKASVSDKVSDVEKTGDETTSDKPGKADSAKKSFLSELFEMPKLDAKSAKKEEVGKYLDMADRRERQISAREEMLMRREERLKAIEKSIDEKLVKLDEERKFIAKTLQDEKDLKGERLDKLITLYDKMEPKKAAPQIEKLDKDLVVGLFKGLKQKQVTTILEAMSPEKSVEIAEYFGRVKSGKEYDLLKELNSSLRQEFAECKDSDSSIIADAKKPDPAPPKAADPAPKDKPKESQPAH